MCLQLLTAPPSSFSLSTWTIILSVTGHHLKFRHRQVCLLVFSPETTDPRVSDHVHRGYPWVLQRRRLRRGDEMSRQRCLSIPFTTCCKSSFGQKKASGSLQPTMHGHARGQPRQHSRIVTHHGGRLLGYYCSLQKMQVRTHGHAESLPIVAVELVGSLLQRRVDDQLVTSPVVPPPLRRAADGMTVHAVRQT